MSPGHFRLDWRGDRTTAGARRGAVRGLTLAAEHLLGEARTEVPLDEGTLSRSGRREVDADDLVASVVFETPYAEVQHEREDYQHPNGRKDHYLSDPAEREGEVMLGLVAAAIRREMRRG